jgi:hypothetical protein
MDKNNVPQVNAADESATVSVNEKRDAQDDKSSDAGLVPPKKTIENGFSMILSTDATEKAPIASIREESNMNKNQESDDGNSPEKKPISSHRKNGEVKYEPFKVTHKYRIYLYTCVLCDQPQRKSIGLTDFHAQASPTATIPSPLLSDSMWGDEPSLETGTVDDEVI